jgi:hypothetical protein
VSPADLDLVRAAVSRVDALAHAAEDLFDGTMSDGRTDAALLERLGQLLGMATEASRAALALVDGLTDGPDPEALRAVVWHDGVRHDPDRDDAGGGPETR